MWKIIKEKTKMTIQNKHENITLSFQNKQITHPTRIANIFNNTGQH